MSNDKSDLLDNVAKYYSEKLAQHGQTPEGVDWNGKQSQNIRFDQLSKVIDSTQDYTINDLGCGYGAYYEYLKTKSEQFTYTGLDVSEDMILAAKERFQGLRNIQFISSSIPKDLTDYTVASGIFNVMMKQDKDQWYEYILETILTMNKYSKKGFSFNCLTSYSDSDKMRDYLYYADPCKIFDFCKKNCSRNVSILHDYDLYEFTIIVRK